MIFKNFWSKFVGHNIGIDLGTASTLIYVEGQGIVLNEPTVVSIDTRTKKTIAVGEEAKKMLGRTPEAIKAIRPIKDGVIGNFEVTEELLKYFIKKVQARGLFARPRIVVAVPSGITDVERRAVSDSVSHSGASDVWLIAEPMAAAIGVGLPIESPSGNMVIDIGGGTTEIAVIALSDIVCNISIRIAGDEMNIAIVEYLKKNYKLLIGETTGEEIKIQIGSAELLKSEKSMEVNGRDSVGGLPKSIKINSKEIRDALKGTMNEIIMAVKRALEKTPPELSSDIIDRGITLAGGGALLRSLDSLISKETGLKVETAEIPRECVIRGTARVLEKFEQYQGVLDRGI